MRRAATWLIRFHQAEHGPTSAEYAVMLGLILGGLFLVITSLGGSSATWWQENADRIVTAIDP